MERATYLPLINQALEEDAAFNDLTAIATVSENDSGHATITAKANGVLSGTAVAEDVFRWIDERIVCQWHAKDGDRVNRGSIICKLSGSLRSLLAAERTALNFLQQLSGIATATRAYVDAVASTACSIADTRKTTPGFRLLEKEAVRHGGGINHRVDLQSGMLIKENHIEACGSITRAITACRALQRSVWIEVECETIQEVQEAIQAKPDMILLDNMTPEEVRKARAIIPTTILLEASGNITLHNVRSYAETGVDRIAIGAITHSAPALDLSMRIISETAP